MLKDSEVIWNYNKSNGCESSSFSTEVEESATWKFGGERNNFNAKTIIKRAENLEEVELEDRNLNFFESFDAKVNATAKETQKIIKEINSQRN